MHIKGELTQSKMFICLDLYSQTLRRITSKCNIFNYVNYNKFPFTLFTHVEVRSPLIYVLNNEKDHQRVE